MNTTWDNKKKESLDRSQIVCFGNILILNSLVYFSIELLIINELKLSVM